MTKKQTYELWNWLQEEIAEHYRFGDYESLMAMEVFEEVAQKMVEILGSVPSDV